MICVPMILWYYNTFSSSLLISKWSGHFSSRSFQAFVAPLPVPSCVPVYHYALNDYLVFGTNWATIMGVVYLGYYYILEPVAAVSCTGLRLIPSDFMAPCLVAIYAANGSHGTECNGFLAKAWIPISSRRGSCSQLDCAVHWTWICRRQGACPTR